MHKDKGARKKFLYLYRIRGQFKWKQGGNEMKRYLVTTEHFSTDKY